MSVANKMRVNSSNRMRDGEAVRILLIGPLPPPIGGMAASFQTLIQDLLGFKEVVLEVIDIAQSRRSGENSLLVHLKSVLVGCRILVGAWRTDVVAVYCTSTSIPSLGLFTLLAARFARKPILLRKASGLDYRMIGALSGCVAELVIKQVDLYLAQTKNLVKEASERGIRHVVWFPTSRRFNRPASHESVLTLGHCRRFVFVGQVRGEKGIPELASAVESLSEDISLDIFGPIFPDVNPTLFERSCRVRYCGLLRQDEVIPTLCRYDAFVMPSKASTEGYPGAIIEALGAGLPVIACSVGGVPEIVDGSVGILLPVCTSESIRTAILEISTDASRFRSLRHNALLRSGAFDSCVWAVEFKSYCLALKASRMAFK